MIFAIILLVLLGLSALLNFGQFASGLAHVGGGPVSARTREVGPRLDEVVLEDNNASIKIAVVEVNGIITGAAIDQQGINMVDVIKAQLDSALDDRRVKAVILKVDSPGGEVLASDEISEAIKHFQAGQKSNGQVSDHSRGKPVIVSMGNLAASGGYYISAPCRWIVANKMTITASIGVIMHTWNYRGLIDKIGIEPETFKSGKFKDMLSGSRATNEIPPEERQMVQKLIDETYGQFKNVVADGRKGKLADNWADYADGRVLSGTEALEHGFVDELGDFETAVTSAKKIAGITGDVNLIRYQQRYDISDFFRMFGQDKTDVHTVKVDMGFDAPKLQAGQMYFLSPALFH